MKRTIPSDAFDYYVALGPKRSYEIVAKHYSVSKRGVTKRASSENWTDRLAVIEREVQERTDARLANELEDTRVRHTKMVRAMQARALKGMQQFPLNTGMEAVRAAEMSIKLERLLMGEASDRTEVSVQETTKREMARWLVPKEAGGDEADTVGGVAGGGKASGTGEQLGGRTV